MIYEQRLYTIELSKRELLIDEVKKFLSICEKFGVKGLGPFRPVIGNSNELLYYMIYDSMAHREKTWEAFDSDPDIGKWRKELFERAGKAGGMGLINEATTLLSPAW